ncbi:hypothetical protein N9242_06180 [Vicingaceae bacterium]|nr:hypothetical protein [Vicingaceae bacterium]
MATLNDKVECHETKVEKMITRRTGVKDMTEFLVFFGFIAAWFALQMWILPRFGVST